MTEGRPEGDMAVTEADKAVQQNNFQSPGAYEMVGCSGLKRDCQPGDGGGLFKWK